MDLASSKITILGAGSCGTAFAFLIANNGHNVSLWARNDTVVNEINRHRTNHQFLSNITLPISVTATTSLSDAVAGADLVILAIPSHAVRIVTSKVKPFLRASVTVLSLSKGLELSSGKRMSEVITEVLDGVANVVVLSGPCHAEEVVMQLPTAVVLASSNLSVAQKISRILASKNFHVQLVSDVIGTELSAFFKNIIALAAGVIRGAGFGDNAAAALITNGLAEMREFALALGAKEETIRGLAGIGDLVVTCTSQHSRNFRAGFLLGKGKSLKLTLKQMGMAVEGVGATTAAYELSLKYNLKLPITNGLYGVLYGGVLPEVFIDKIFVKSRNWVPNQSHNRSF